MQTIHQYIKVAGYRGENVTSAGAASSELPFLVEGMESTFVVHLVDAEGHAAAPADIADVASWRFILAGDWDPATAPCFTTRTVVWDAAAATFTVTLDKTRTNAMLAFLGDAASRQIGCEIAGLATGGTWDRPRYVVQWVANIRGRRDSNGPAPDPATGELQAGSLVSSGGSGSASVSDAGALTVESASLPAELDVQVGAWYVTPEGSTTQIAPPPSGRWRSIGGAYVPCAVTDSPWVIYQVTGQGWRLAYAYGAPYCPISNFTTAPALGEWSEGYRIVSAVVTLSWQRSHRVATAADMAALADGIALAETDTLQNTRAAIRTLLARLARFAVLALAFLPFAARAQQGGTTLDTMVPTNVLYTAVQFEAALGALLQAQPDAVTFELHRLILGDHERRMCALETNRVDGTPYVTAAQADALVQSRIDAFAVDIIDPLESAYNDLQNRIRASQGGVVPYYLATRPVGENLSTNAGTVAVSISPARATRIVAGEAADTLAVTGFTGASLNAAWLALDGFAGVSFPAGTVVAGGAYAAGSNNLYRVYAVGATLLVERVAP